MNEIKKMAAVAYHALDEKKGEKIQILDVSKIFPCADYFIITNGSGSTQVQALVDEVEEKMHKAGFSLKSKEGRNMSTWMLLDYGDVIIHIFDRENREYYHLERIWSDAGVVEAGEILSEADAN